MDVSYLCSEWYARAKQCCNCRRKLSLHKVSLILTKIPSILTPTSGASSEPVSGLSAFQFLFTAAYLFVDKETYLICLVILGLIYEIIRLLGGTFCILDFPRCI